MRSPIENVALRLHQQESDPHPQYLKRVDYRDPATVTPPPLDAALLARIAADEAAAVALQQRVHVLEDEIPSQAALDARYLRRDAWIINIDPGGDFGEILVNVDTLEPVYLSDAPLATSTPVAIAPFGAVGLNGTVTCMILAGTKLYLGGVFTSVTDASGTYTRNRAACIDLATALWTAWDPNVTGTSVDGIALTTDGINAFIVGTFTAVGGSSRTNIAQVDTVTGLLRSWTAASTLSAGATGVAVSSSLVYVSGLFTTAGASTRNYFAAFNVFTGALSTWDAGANAPAFGTTPYGLTPIVDASGGVVLLGGFISLHGTSRFYAGRVDATTGALDTTWLSPFAFDGSGNTEATLLAAWRGQYLLGKSFGFPGSNIVYRSYADVGGSVGGFTSGVTAGVIVDAESISCATYDASDGPGSPIYIGGNFSAIKGTARTHLAAIDPTSGSALAGFAPVLNGVVRSLAFTGGKIIAAGAFTAIGGQVRNRLAIINPSTGIAS